MNYYEIDEPEACREQLELYKVHNDPVRDFLNEVIPQIRVEAIPNEYLYALYGAWLEKNNPAAKKSMLGSTRFIAEVKELIVNFPQWYFPEKQFRVRHYLDGQELTLYLYSMTEWMKDEKATDPDVRYRLKWKRSEMRGMLLTKYKDRKTGRPKKEDDDDIDNDIDILGSMQCD